MADMRLGQASSGRWTVSLTNNNDVPGGLVIPVKLKYNGGNEVEISVRKGVSASAVTEWYTAVGVEIDTDLISVSGSATFGDKTYVVTKVNWRVTPAEGKYINVSPSILSIASGAGSTGQFTVDTNVESFSVSASSSNYFSVTRNGNVVTVTALSENPGTSSRDALVTVSDDGGEAESAQVSVRQEASGEPTEVDVTVYGTFEQTDLTVPGEMHNELVLSTDTDSIRRNDSIEIMALYTTFKTPSLTYGSRRGMKLGAAPGDVVIAEEDVTDKCSWETDGDVSVGTDGTVTNENRGRSNEVATISATYQGMSSQKSVELEGGVDDGEWRIEIRPTGDVEPIENGGSMQFTCWDCCYDTNGHIIYQEDVTRDEGTVWSIESGGEFAAVLYGNVTNVNTGDEDKEVTLKAQYKFTVSDIDKKTLVMKGTGDSSPRLNISVPRGEPIPRTGGSVSLYIDSNLPSWNISVESISGDPSSEWFEVGAATGTGVETRVVTAGAWNKKPSTRCRKVRVTVSGGDGLSSSVVVTQLCSVNPTLSPASSTFPGPEGGVAKLHLSPGGDITSTWRLYTSNGATGVSFDEHVDNVREITGVSVDGESVQVNVYIKPSDTWNSARYITFAADFETISARKSGTVTQLSAKLKLKNSSDAEVMSDIAYDDDTVYELAIDSNVTWEVVEPQEEWIHASKNGDSLELSFDNNDGGERTGTVQLRAVANHDKTYEISIRQNGQ